MTVSSKVVCCVRYSKGVTTDFDITLLITFGALGRQCANIQFQEPQTRLQWFDTLVTPNLLYGVKIWEQRQDRFGEAFSLNNCPISTKTLLQTVTGIQ